MRCPKLDELPTPPRGRVGFPWTEQSSQLLDDKRLPRVSIVTPSYNQAEFIEETIRSVLLQGYPDLEYIIIDGGSMDGSVDIIREYERWLAYWVTEPDRGQSHAINKGWSRATGDVIAYINSDDCYVANALTVAVENFRDDSCPGMVYGNAIVVDEADNRLRTWQAQRFDLKTMLTVGNRVPQPAIFFSRAALATVGCLDERWHMIMDYEFCIRVGMRLPTICLSTTLARFRDHAHSKSQTRFETTARELIDFVTNLSPHSLSPKEWQTVKRATLSRIHYEWALMYLAQERPEKSKAIKQLYQSVMSFPSFALKRPLQTSYLVKELLWSRM